MNWAETSNKEKVRLIIEKVMGWTSFIQWEDMYQAYHWHISELPIHYPVAFWNNQQDEWSVFYREQENATTFDPLHNMKDAWQVVEQFEEVVLLRHVPSKYLVQLWHHTKPHSAATATTAEEAICMAALKAHGVEIE